MGCSEVREVSADIALVCLGSPSAEEFDGVVLEASAGGSGRCSDAERMAREVLGREAGGGEDLAEVVVEPVSGGYGSVFVGE